MPSNNENVLILTEIVKRLTPRLLAVILTIALFSLSGVIVFALHKGGEVKLNGWSFSEPKVQDEMAVNTENGTNIPLLKPLDYIGFKTLEALRGWYRVNAI